MARMLGRYRVRGCCPGAREGRPGPDCSGGYPAGTRAAKRREAREVARMIRESAENEIRETEGQ
jgi:hypothetical protein